MEIYKDLSSPASQEFEKLLNSQLSKIHIEEGKIIDGKISDFIYFCHDLLVNPIRNGFPAIPALFSALQLIKLVIWYKSANP